LDRNRRTMAGQILGDRYEVEKQLGRQSGRWTLLATDQATGMPVILKMVTIDDDLHPDIFRLFEREVNILKSLDHPSLPKHLDYFEIELPKQNKALVLVQSYIEGISIDKYLQKGRTFNEEETQKIGRAILRILVYLHNNEPSIVHRDIKPSNILLANSGTEKAQVCLVDFGSVKRLASQPSNTTIMTLVGDEKYMAPEVLGGRVVLASDLYSLGLTLVTLLTGMEPDEFPRKGTDINISQIDNCSAEFLAWLQCITDVRVEKRYASAEEALEALKQTG